MRAQIINAIKPAYLPAEIRNLAFRKDFSDWTFYGRKTEAGWV